MKTVIDALQSTLFIWLLAGIFVLFGGVIVRRAYVNASTTEGRNSIIAGIGSAFVTGAILAVLSLYLQQAFAKQNEESSWRANVSTSWKMAGMVAEGHDLQEPVPLSFSGKELPNADFQNASAQGITFRDAKLRAANFEDADLRNADFVAADLTASQFEGADLSGAKLQVAHFVRAELYEVASMKGAFANANTCWPEGFLTSDNATFKKLRAQLIPVETTDGATGEKATSLGYEHRRARPCRPFD